MTIDTFNVRIIEIDVIWRIHTNTKSNLEGTDGPKL